MPIETKVKFQIKENSWYQNHVNIRALPAGLQNVQETVILVPYHFYLARYFLATFMRFFLAKCRDLRAFL